MKEKFNKAKEFIKDPKKRAIVALSFYLIFFFVLAIIVRINPDQVDNEENKVIDNNEHETSILGQLVDNNYQFIYTITNNDKVLIYQGKSFGIKKLFTMDNLSQMNNISYYYQEGSTYLMLKDNNYILTENPFLYKEFLDINEINRLLKYSEFQYKTVSKDNTTFSVYHLKVNDAVDLINETENLSDDSGNIIITLYGEKNINKIVIDLSSYCNYFDKSIDKYEIVMEFSDISLIEDIVLSE